MRTERVQKLIASSGLCSRRKAEELIKEGRVLINDHHAQLGDIADPFKDRIKVDGKPIEIKRKDRVFLINKPIGVICSCSDNHGRRTVLELLPRNLRKGLYPIGRLDLDSRGAILLTNNGELTLKLSHPRYSHKKTYLVWVKGVPSMKSLDRWRSGINLDGRITLPMIITPLKHSEGKSLLKIILKEGRNRQIRRIAELIGNPVLDLKRIQIANIRLDSLKEGCWKELGRDSWENLLKSPSI